MGAPEACGGRPHAQCNPAFLLANRACSLAAPSTLGGQHGVKRTQMSAMRLLGLYTAVPVSAGASTVAAAALVGLRRPRQLWPLLHVRARQTDTTHCRMHCCLPRSACMANGCAQRLGAPVRAVKQGPISQRKARRPLEHAPASHSAKAAAPRRLAPPLQACEGRLVRVQVQRFRGVHNDSERRTAAAAAPQARSSTPLHDDTWARACRS